MSTTTLLLMFALPVIAIVVIVLLARNWVTPVEHPEDEASRDEG